MSENKNNARPPASQFLAQGALEKLRWDILDGAFDPDAKLPFAILQERYGVGIGTIREGLSHLVAEGLVKLEAGRGFRVAPVSKADLLDISEMRVDFEKKALADAIANGDDAWESRILTSYHFLEKIEALPLAERLKDASRWNRIHRDFHNALVSACRSRWMLHFHSILFDQADRYRLISLRYRPKGGNRKGEHQAIMRAVLARNVEEACVLAEQHIRNTVEDVLQYSPVTIR